MKIKYILIAAFIGFFSFSVLHGTEPWQKVSARPSEDDLVIVVPEGKIIEFMNTFFRTLNGSVSVTLDFGDGIILDDDDTNDIQPSEKYIGPLTLTLGVSGGSAGHLTTIYRIRDNPGDLSALPNTALVIPEDASGPVSIMLESSTDLANWTEANPGEYASSTARRYFRIRAIQN